MESERDECKMERERGGEEAEKEGSVQGTVGLGLESSQGPFRSLSSLDADRCSALCSAQQPRTSQGCGLSRESRGSPLISDRIECGSDRRSLELVLSSGPV